MFVTPVTLSLALKITNLSNELSHATSRKKKKKKPIKTIPEL